MRRLWYCLFYALCSFAIVFSLYWMALPLAKAPQAEPPSSGSELPSTQAQAGISGVPIPESEKYYLCDEGGRVAVYRCSSDGTPGEKLETTDIYVNLLPEMDALRLKRGMTVSSRQELDTLLEDLGG